MRLRVDAHPGPEVDLFLLVVGLEEEEGIERQPAFPGEDGQVLVHLVEGEGGRKNRPDIRMFENGLRAPADDRREIPASRPCRVTRIGVFERRSPVALSRNSRTVLILMWSLL